MVSSAAFASSPPANPVSEPSLPTTRWHGRTREIGLRPFAAASARAAFGRPILAACSDYVRVSPQGMAASASQAAT